MVLGNPTVFVTGISGNLAQRLRQQIEDFYVGGVDISPPKTDVQRRFIRMDLGHEEACRARLPCGAAARTVCGHTFLPAPPWKIIWSGRFGERPMARANAPPRCGKRGSGCLACFLLGSAIWTIKFSLCTWTIWHG